MRTIKPNARGVLALCSLILTIHCGSLSELGTSAGNASTSSSSSSDSTTVTVTGSLNSSDSGTTKAVSSGGCVGDAIVATDSAGATREASVDSDCGFAMDLNVGGIYTFAVMLDGEFVASLSFQSGNDGFAVSSLLMMMGLQQLLFGPISIADGVGVPTYQPLQQIDSDGDGTADYYDDDDDGDGTNDEDEEDCDLDGTPDDIDPECDCKDDHIKSDTSAKMARIIAVRPRHHGICQGFFDLPLLRAWCHRVRLHRPVTAWFSCRVDKDTVNADTFRVETLAGEPIECSYRYKRWNKRLAKRTNHHVVRCLHYDDPFAGDTVYVATIDGVQCESGKDVRPGRWAFLTRHDNFYECDEEDEIETSADVEEDDAETDDGDSV